MISCHSRDIGPLGFLMAKLLEKGLMRKEKWRPGGDEYDYGYEMDEEYASACVD